MDKTASNIFKLIFYLLLTSSSPIFANSYRKAKYSVRCLLCGFTPCSMIDSSVLTKRVTQERLPMSSTGPSMSSELWDKDVQFGLGFFVNKWKYIFPKVCLTVELQDVSQGLEREIDPSDTRRLLRIFLAVQRHRHVTLCLHLDVTRHNKRRGERGSVERETERCLTHLPCLAAGTGGLVLGGASGWHGCTTSGTSGEGVGWLKGNAVKSSLFLSSTIYLHIVSDLFISWDVGWTETFYSIQFHFDIRGELCPLGLSERTDLSDYLIWTFDEDLHGPPVVVSHPVQKPLRERESDKKQV